MAYQTEPNWEDAPEGTTGFLPETDDYHPSWVKEIDGVINILPTYYTGGFSDPRSMHKDMTWCSRKHLLIPRPQPQEPQSGWLNIWPS